MKSGSMAACKRLKTHVRFFQESWMTDFGFVFRDDRAVCALCCQNIVCQTSSINDILKRSTREILQGRCRKDRFAEKDVISLRKAKQHFQESDFWGKSNNRK